MSAFRHRFSPRRRLQHLQRLAALRGKSTPLLKKGSSRLWALASVALLLMAVLTLVVGRRYTAQKIDVEQNLRTQLIPALEKELGRKIEVGKIESDYFSRVILHDVVIGRDKNSPLGALVQSKKITILLDAVNLVLRRSDPLQAISKVTLDGPQLFLERDAQGQLNIADLFKKQKPDGPRWSGVIEINDGRLYLRDAILRSASNQTILIDAQNVKGNVRFNGDNPLRYSINIPLAYAGVQRVPVREINLSGTAAPDAQWFALEALWPSAPAALLTDWAFRQREVVAQRGTVGGRARLMWDAALPKAEQIVATGVLTVRGVDGFMTKAIEPGTNRPLLIQNAGGVVKFADRALESGDLTLTALGSRMRLAGKFALVPLTFDVRASSNAFNAERFLTVLRAVNRNAEFQKTRLQTSNARGEVRVTGDARNWTAGGNLAFSNANVAHPQLGTGALSTAVLTFALATQDGQSQVDANFTATRGEYSGRSFGAWQANGNLRGGLQWSGQASAPQMQIRFAANSLSGRSPQLGAWRGDGVSTLVRRVGAQTTAQIGVTKLAGRHPQAGTLGARNLNATVAFENAPGVFSARATAASALGSDAQLPALRGLNWQSGALQTAINWRGSGGNVRLDASTLRARQNQFGVARFGNLRANVNITSARGATNFATHFNARNANLQNAEAGNWRADSLLGIASGRSTRGATPIQADVEARNFAGSQSRYGSWNGNALRITATTPDAAGGGWDGVAALGNTDVSRVNYAALSPALADSVRSAGVLTGKARFTDLGARNPVIKGRARLSQLTLRQNGQKFPLREIETQIAFGGQQLRLAGLRAQSEFGPLQADAQSNLTTNDLRLSLVAPRVEVSGAQLNPYLAASGIRLVGNATGRLRVLTTNPQSAGPQNPNFQTRFDFVLPRAEIFAAQTGNSAAPIRVANARLNGAGNLSFSSAQNWRFSGEAELAARHAANVSADNDARAADLQITTRGTVARNASGFVPDLQGEVRASSLLLPLAGNEVFALQSANAQFDWQPQALQISRFVAAAGGESQFLGHATLRPATGERLAFDGQLLLERFDAARAQTLLQNLQSENRDFSDLPQVAGVLFARADFSGAFARGELAMDDIDLQTRLYRGRVEFRDTILPVDAARLETTLQFPLRREIALDEFVVWSRGARLSVNGVLTPQDETLALDLNATVNTLRVQHLFNVAALRPVLQAADESGEMDGLLSAQFRIGGTLAAPQVNGRTALRLAQVYGLDIERASGDVALQTEVAPGGLPEFRLAVSEIAGVAEGAPFSGSLIADSRENRWNVALQTDEDISTNRLLRAAQAQGESSGQAWRDVPLRGALGGSFNLAGTLKDDDGNFRFAVGEGALNIDTGTLLWRGRELGELRADLRLRNGVLQARQFELERAGELDANGDATEAARLRVAGVLPVALDAPILDAHVTIENEQLSFVLEVLEELRRSLAERGQNVSYLDAILERLEGLPSTVEGRFDMQAQLEQSWRVPVVEVRSLRARDVSYLTASGDRRRLPDVTARFIYDGNDNGAIAIQTAELRLPSEDRTRAAGDENEDNDSDDLLIRTLAPGRIVPGGELDLTAEILNADLQQLAQWLPNLRDANGEPIIKGRLSDFVLQLTGTMSSPSVVGSLQGEDWEYRGYSLDAVRLNRFAIADGKLQVERGALTFVKGEFQSSAVWGFLPWTWGDANGETGVSFTRPMQLNLSMDKNNFGALEGIFIPQIINIGADDFNGELTVNGTLNEPQLSGEATIQNGAFRFRSAMAEMDVGVKNLTGVLRFAEGNRIEIIGAGLSGKLVPANEVQAPTTGNEGTVARQERDQKRPSRNPPPSVAGDFNLLGTVALDLTREVWSEPRLAAAAQNYDLRLTLLNGSYTTPTFSGVRDVQAVATWKTGAGSARENQNIQWAFSANGNAARNRREGSGRILSFASLMLAPNFATSVEAFLNARAENFSGAAEFAALPELQSTTDFREAMQAANGRPSRLNFDTFRFNWQRVAQGQVNGVLILDNQPVTPPAAPPFSTPRERPRAFAARIQETALIPGRSTPDESTPRLAQGPARGAQPNLPLRIVGTLTMEQTELYGAPPASEAGDRDEDATTAGTAPRGVLAGLPSAPSFDVKLVAARDVEFVSSNLRATITGDLEFSGTPRDPVVFGTLFTGTGSITFPNARARLESGEITITMRRDPATDMLRTRIEVDVTARGRSGRYEITLRARGPLDTGEGSTQDLRIDISSNPPLSTDEAFSQLLGISTISGGDSGQEEAYARALVGFLSGPLFAGIERKLEQTLGLDSIVLDYRVDEPIGIEIGKAIGDRLYISYRRALSRGPSERTPFDLRIDYRIKGDFQIGLETDETDTRRVTLRKSWRF